MTNFLITKDDVNVKVWSHIRQSYGVVVDYRPGSDRPVGIDFERDDVYDTYSDDGRYGDGTHIGQDLYWSKPEISQPPKPVRMVEKTFWLHVDVVDGKHPRVRNMLPFPDRDRALGELFANDDDVKVLPITIEVEA